MKTNWKQKLEQRSGTAWKRLDATTLRSGPMDGPNATAWCERLGDAIDDPNASGLQSHQGHFHVKASAKAAIACMNESPYTQRKSARQYIQKSLDEHGPQLETRGTAR